jgi:putative phage-type endonuclease
MTAIMLTRPDASREEWLEARQAGIGASEIAAVMGISPYDSPFSLWWRKRNNWGADVNAEMSTGTFLEDTIAAWFIQHGDPNENLVFERSGLYHHPDRAWQLATPDRLILTLDNCGGLCDEAGLVPNPESTFFIEGYEPCWTCLSFKVVGLLECKWVAYSWDGWGAEDTDDIPVHYRAQALWQLDVMGVDEVIVCALGPGGFRTYRVRRDEKDLTQMREAGRRFWQSLIDDIPPDVDDHAATLPILRRVNAQIEDREQEVPAWVADGWVRAKAFKDLATKVERRYAAELRTCMGNAKTAVLAGKAVATRTSDDKLTRAKR